MTSPVSSRAGLSDRASSLISGSVSSVISVSSSEHEDSVPMPSTISPSVVSPSPLPVTEPGIDVAHIKRHAEHFHAGGDVKFLVGPTRTLYQLHADILARQSGWFRTYRAAQYEGCSDSALPPGWCARPGPFCTIYVHFEKEVIQFERPGAYTIDEQTGAIIIEYITVEEFDSFLAILYPTDFMDFGLGTQAEWTAVLKVAHLWNCSAIRTLAIHRLYPAFWVGHAFERLVLARKYAVDEWVEQALADLIERDAHLSSREIKQMLPEDIARVTGERERRARRQCPGMHMPVPPAEVSYTPSRAELLRNSVISCQGSPTPSTQHGVAPSAIPSRSGSTVHTPTTPESIVHTPGPRASPSPPPSLGTGGPSGPRTSSPPRPAEESRRPSPASSPITRLSTITSVPTPREATPKAETVPTTPPSIPPPPPSIPQPPPSMPQLPPVPRKHPWAWLLEPQGSSANDQSRAARRSSAGHPAPRPAAGNRNSGTAASS
ncbi:hypothetical protein PENSPDRAFT_692944 [Peniophora sp. CONT]|nr:hypothetical protein PENSPDRAFT_692944 [Peniophora sp. CONT]